MELMWLVYAVENLTYNSNVLVGPAALTIGLISIVAVIQFMCMHSSETIEDFLRPWKKHFPFKTFLVVCGVCLTLHTLLPSRDTAIKMAGAYLIQTVVTSEKANNLGDAAYRATLRQLEKWAAEVPELKDMNNELKVEEGK